MKAGALLIYGDKYKYLPNLKSPRASVFSIFNALIANHSEFLPEWVNLREPFALNGTIDNFIYNLNEFEKHIHLNGCDIVFIYFSGHGYSVYEGDTYIYSSDSTPGDNETGISLTRILKIICNKKIGHLVICLDLCRTHQGKVTFKDNFVSGLKMYNSQYSSLVILTSTLEGEVSFGGLGDNPSPFALGLVEMFSEKYISTPQIYFQNCFENILRKLYEKTELQYSKPDFIPIPKIDKRNLFGYYISNSKYNDAEISTFTYIHNFADTVISRETNSFRSDRFISSLEELIPLDIFIGDKKVLINDLILENNYPIVIVGESGSGKTLTAKAASIFIATSYKNEKTKKIAIYFNAGFLNNFSDTPLSPFEVLYKYIKEGRYFTSLDDIETLFEKFQLVILVDGVEDLKNRTRLITFLKDCNKQIGANIIIFCQPYDKSWILNKLNLTFILTGEIIKINKSKLKTIDNNLYSRFSNKFERDILPIEYQLFKRYSNINEITIGEILTNDYVSIEQSILKAVDRQKNFNYDDQEELKKNIFIAFRQFAVFLRENGTYQFFKEEIARYFFREESNNFDFFPINFKEFIEIGERAGIFSRDSNTLRFSHRSTQELLIAFEWKAAGLSSNELIKKSQSSVWASCIATYSVIEEKKYFPFEKIVSENAYTILECVNRGLVLDTTEIEMWIENILKYSSHWTRNKVSKTLSVFPYAITRKLIEKYQTQDNFDKKASILIAIGKSHDYKTIDYLLDEYKRLLNVYDGQKSEIQYLRRRILDVLKNKFKINHLLEWTENRTLHLSEWLRLIRSVRIETDRELELLKNVLPKHHSKIEKKLLKTLLLYKKLTYIPRDSYKYDEITIQMSNLIVTLLKCDKSERYYRTIPALIIEELKLKNLVAPLFDSIQLTKSIYTLGEIIYVIGNVGDKLAMERIWNYLNSFPRSEFYNSLDEKDLQGFYNDVKLGLEAAIEKETFSNDMGLPFLPNDIKIELENFLSIKQDKKIIN